MTETVTKKIPTINAVEGFDPAEFTRQLPNEDGSTSLYLDVKYRLLWFRLHRPQGKIVPDIVHVDEKSAVVTATAIWRSQKRRQLDACWRLPVMAHNSAAIRICCPVLSQMHPLK